jgi:hypothetical protein
MDSAAKKPPCKDVEETYLYSIYFFSDKFYKRDKLTALFGPKILKIYVKFLVGILVKCGGFNM